MDFTGKRVLVTGGTRGIGRATVEAFIAAGARVALNGSTKESTAKAVAELAAGDRVIAAPGDVGKVEDCERLVGAAVAGLGGLDVLVNNAGDGGHEAPIEQMTVEEWDRTINVNLRGTMFCIKHSVPFLRAALGSVVNLGSILGIRGNGLGAFDYCASKGAIVNLTRELGIALAPEIRVNCLCPGAIDTDMLRDLGRLIGEGDLEVGYEVLGASAPQRRVARASEMASTILFLASEQASFVTGAILVADGGAVAKVG